MFTLKIDLTTSENSLLQINIGRPATFEVARADCISIDTLHKDDLHSDLDIYSELGCRLCLTFENKSYTHTHTNHTQKTTKVTQSQSFTLLTTSTPGCPPPPPQVPRQVSAGHKSIHPRGQWPLSWIYVENTQKRL